MRTKNTKMSAELRRLARRGRLSDRAWLKHQALHSLWGETFTSSAKGAIARSTQADARAIY
jgi:hypothetical protein